VFQPQAREIRDHAVWGGTIVPIRHECGIRILDASHIEGETKVQRRRLRRVGFAIWNWASVRDRSAAHPQRRTIASSYLGRAVWGIEETSDSDRVSTYL